MEAKNVVTIDDKQFIEYLSYESIQKRIDEFVKEELKKGTWAHNEVVFLCMLEGAKPFALDIMKSIRKNAKNNELPNTALGFIKYTSYDGMESSGNLKEVQAIPPYVKGKNVVIIEDIVDTGLTMRLIKQKLFKEYHVASCQVISLLYKPRMNNASEWPDIVGFPIPDLFVVGYGMDYNQKGRDLNAIYQLLP